MASPFNENTIVQLKLSHIIAFVSGLFSAIIIIGGFFYNTLNSKIEEKVDEKIFDMDRKYIDQKFNEQKEYFQRLETSVQSINVEIKEILKEKNKSTMTESFNPTQPTQPINTN